MPFTALELLRSAVFIVPLPTSRSAAYYFGQSARFVGTLHNSALYSFGKQKRNGYVPFLQKASFVWLASLTRFRVSCTFRMVFFTPSFARSPARCAASSAVRSIRFSAYSTGDSSSAPLAAVCSACSLVEITLRRNALLALGRRWVIPVAHHPMVLSFILHGSPPCRHYANISCTCPGQVLIRS